MNVNSRLAMIERLLDATGGEPMPEPLSEETYAAIDHGQAIDEGALSPGQLRTLRAVMGMLVTIPRFEANVSDAERRAE